jgi:hypothetical protein
MLKSGNIKHQNYVKQKERGKIRKIELIRMKGGKCQMCGYNRNYASLCFHHEDPNIKELGLDIRHLSNNSWTFILEEASKCKLLCHNCHGEVHNPGFHISKINKVKTTNTSFYQRIPKKIFKCHCGNKMSRNARSCIKCIRNEKIEWPPLEDLKEMLKASSYLAVGKMLGVSDNAVRKHLLKFLNIS